MKKLILLLIIILGSHSLFSQEVLMVKIYQIDGSTKQFNIEDIADLRFIHSNLSYSMSVFQKDDLKNDIDIRDIDSIIFENKQVMKVILPGNIKTYNISEIDSIIFTFNTCTEIQIGELIWMCKNLDVDHYRNGSTIPQIRDLNEWLNLKTGAWCYYNNDSAMGKIYGRLYNWYAVNDARGLAPKGWHVASHEEWTKLIEYLGDVTVAGGKIKETGTMHWNYPNTGATNESGFTALPGGMRGNPGTFRTLGDNGYWWSSTSNDNISSWPLILNFNSPEVDFTPILKYDGLSVRCVKDE
jgi:uncharacterized protein (TIGR02145 family)